MLMGVTALVAAYIANSQPTLRDWLVTWLIEAFLAFAIGMLAMWQKSKIAGTPLVSTPSMKFARGFAPPLICGVAITLGLWHYEHYEIMAPVWMLCYGAAVVCSGAFSVRVVPVDGLVLYSSGNAGIRFTDRLRQLPNGGGLWRAAH